ncbi:MAG: class I SAM-dependent methyltransferase, partial [Planctomycetota bacterium]
MKIPPTHTEPPFPALFETEDRHFWFRARNRVIDALVASTVSRMEPGFLALEVGCGTGNVLRHLEKTCRRGRVVGMDLFAGGLRFARTRTSCPLVTGDMAFPPFRRPFDLVGLFDVLEHLPDDDSALRNIRGLLRDGGRLVVTVPAHQFLWSYVDEFSQHRRRYGPADLKRAL